MINHPKCNKKRICNHCNKPMGNSWHTETDVGELELFVHVKCVEEWHICKQMGDMADFVKKNDAQDMESAPEVKDE